MEQGWIVHLMMDRGFGFIRIAGHRMGQRDMFFHRSVLEGVSFDDLREGQVVEFDHAKGKTLGREQATRVRLAGAAATEDSRQDSQFEVGDDQRSDQA